MGESVVDGLFEALATAGNYYDAGAAAARIRAVGRLSPAQLERLQVVYWSNDQVFGGVLPGKQLEPLYRENGQDWPPARPAPMAG